MNGRITARVYRDGTELNSSVPSLFDVPGSYVVMIGGSSEEREALRFTIVNPTTGMLQSYRMPYYFAVTDLTVDGEAREVAPNVVDMSDEGDYEITYYCQPTGEAYQLSVTVDHTPPTLALEAIENSVAKSPVDISDDERGAQVGRSQWQEPEETLRLLDEILRLLLMLLI